MSPTDALILLTAFLAILSLGAVVADILLTTPAHRDARRRNERYDERPWWES